MSAPRFEIVRANVGYHARFRAANGRIVWWTETYTRRRGAFEALAHFGKYAYADSTPWQFAIFTQRYGSVEVRDVDERGSA